MSILDILETHTGRTFDKDGMYVCQCGHYIGTNKGKAERHRAHVAQVLEQHEREAKAEALEEAAGAYPVMLRDMVSRGSVAAWLRARANQYKEGADNGR